MLKPAVILAAVLWACVAASHAATISGTVTEEGTGTPVADATVALTDAALLPLGPALASTTTDATGNYTLTFTVDPAGPITGEIVLEVVAPGHAPRRFGDPSGRVDCFWFCELEPGSLPDRVGAFTVADSDSLVRDIELPPSAPVSGRVTGSGSPLALVPVLLFTPEREPINALGTATDVLGEFSTPFAVGNGTFYAAAGLEGGLFTSLLYGNFVSQAYSGFDCEFLSCAVTQTTPIVVSGATPVTGIDFALTPGGAISGQIVYADTGLPLAAPDSATIRVYTADEGRALAQVPVSSTAASTYLIEGLAGSYILEIDPGPSSQTHLLRILNDGTPCPFGGCDRSVAAPIAVGSGGTLSGVDFALERGGRIGGSVVDALTGDPIVPGSAAVLFLDVLDATGRVAGGGQVNPVSGEILGLDGIRPGSYFVATGLRFFGRSFTGVGAAAAVGAYSDQLSGGVACPGLACDLTAPGAAPVTITAGATTRVTFSLSLGHTLSGTVTGAVGGAPLSGRRVEVFTPAGRRVAVEATDASGRFETGGLPDGPYRVVVKDGGRSALGNYGADGLGYFGKVFGATGSCLHDLCDPGTGTEVVVSGADVTGIDFALDAGPNISGQVIDTLRGLPILLTVDVLDGGGARVGTWSTIASSDATYRTGALSPGIYTIVPRTTRAFAPVPPAVVPKAGPLAPGLLEVEIRDEAVTGADLGVLLDLVFGAGFEREGG